MSLYASTPGAYPSGCHIKNRTSFRGIQPLRYGLPRRLRQQEFCEALAQDGDQAPQPPSNINQTLADLDAMLGIELETEHEQHVEQETKSDSVQSPVVQLDIAPEVLKQLADAEAQRLSNAGGFQQQQDVNSKVESLLKKISQISSTDEKDKDENSPVQQALRKDVEDLLNVLSKPRSMDSEDLKVFKERVFGPQVFWITGTAPHPEIDGGIIVKGNVRTDRETVFDKVAAKTAEIFPDGKYIVRFIEDVSSEEWMTQTEGEPKVIFEVLPAVLAVPEPTPTWARAAGGLLLLLTIGSSLQFSLAANIGLLPKETLSWLANPANLESLDQMLPPGLETFDPVPFFQSCIAVGGAALLPQLAHEIGHVVAAAMKGIKIELSFLIPNPSLGTFGSVTPLKSFARNRRDLFDFAAGGLVSGAVVSLALFLAGLASSHGGVTADPGLVPVPSQLFSGSLFLGLVSKLFIDPVALTKPVVYVSPLMIGGWCGMVAASLNALPVGNLDGGRMMGSAFGKTALALTSLASYAGLGLGILGASLSLPFGLYVLICQRTSEKYIQDEISGVGEARRLLALAVVGVALLTLLPGAPELPDNLMLTGSPTNFI